MYLVLTTLCAAGIASGFGGSIRNINSSTFPSLLLVQVIALGIGSRAFFRVMEVLSISGLCRNKFVDNFRVAVDRPEKRGLGLRLSRVTIMDWNQIVSAMSPLF